MLSALTPRNLTKHLSHFQLENALFPHLSPRVQSFSAMLHPILSALFIKSSSKDPNNLLTIVEIVLARTVLRIFSTHFIDRSIMARSILERALNQILVLRDLDLIFTRSCFVVKPTISPFSHSEDYYVKMGISHILNEKKSIKGYFPNLIEQSSNVSLAFFEGFIN